MAEMKPVDVRGFSGGKALAAAVIWKKTPSWAAETFYSFYTDGVYDGSDEWERHEIKRIIELSLAKMKSSAR